MRTYFLLMCLTITLSSLGMHLQPGQKVSWHERVFRVTERHERGNEITIVMERPSHKALCVPLALEQITRTFDREISSEPYESPRTTTGKTVITTAGKLTLKSSLVLATLMAYYCI